MPAWFWRRLREIIILLSFSLLPPFRDMFRRFFRNQLFGVRVQRVVVFLYLQHFLSPENNKCSIQREPQDLIRRQDLPLADGLGFPVHRRVLASESDVSEITDSDFPKELEVIPLHGHFFDMIGIRTPDDVVFLADCISSESTLDKYQITFIYDIAEYLNTLDKVESMETAMFVPAHSDVTGDITGIVQLNRQKVFDISNDIQSIIKTPMCFEELLKLLFDEYGLVMDFEQYVFGK